MEHEKADFQGAENGLQSILDAYDKMIASYDLVIADLSGEIYDPVLRAQKEPVVAYLKAMREQWIKCRDDAQRQMDMLSGNSE